MLNLIYWILAPLFAAALGYLIWQGLWARQALARHLEDRRALAELFDRQGAQLLREAKTDRRVLRALKDSTMLSMTTTMFYRIIERGYDRLMIVAGVLILALLAAAAVFVSHWLTVLALAAALAQRWLPLHPRALRQVQRDLGALAMSLALWHEYDAEICESVTRMSSRFEPLLDYVKAHYLGSRPAANTEQ